LPLRAISDLVGLGIDWDSKSQSVMLYSSNEGIPSKDNMPIDTEPNDEDKENLTGEFSFWHFNRDEGPMIVKAFNEAYPNVKINYTFIPERDNQYQDKLTAAIKSGSGVPDVFGVESAFAKTFVNMPGAFADLTELSKNYVKNMVPPINFPRCF